MLTDAIFMWIYCMNIPDVLTLLALFTTAYLAAVLFLGRRVYAVCAVLLLAVWLAAVVMHTIVLRSPATVPEAVWLPFRSYIDAFKAGGQPEQLRSNFMNAVLFYPAGLLLCSLVGRDRSRAVSFASAVIPLMLVSIVIEAVQYRCCLGLAQTDDIIHNSLGAAFGAAAAIWLLELPKYAAEKIFIHNEVSFMSDIKLSAPERIMRSIVQRYNHEKYWRYRAIVTDPDRGSKLGDLFRLFYIKRADAFNNASMGTHRNSGAAFATPPQLPHGLNGIIVSHNARFGANCKIFHQVTVGEGRGGAPTIGDNVMIGAGAKLIGGIRIGNNVRIGAGCVVMEDVPDNATVVPAKAQIIIRKEQ